MTRRLIVEADGGSRGNPGPAAYGSLVREAATGDVLIELAGHLGVATNNVAEYTGLLEGLRAAMPGHTGDWYFTGEYPTPGGFKVLNTAFLNWRRGDERRAY